MFYDDVPEPRGDRIRSVFRQRKLSARIYYTAFICFTGLLTMAACLPTVQGQKNQAFSRSVFERRILPLLKSSNPSSCAECHLSGVDLKDYVRSSEAQTFASLRDSGMIDLKQPKDSHILQLIQKSTPKTGLITQKIRSAEYAAFRDWITAASQDPKLRTAAALPGGKQAGPAVSNAVIRHARIDNIVASFERNIWSQEGRCMGCHRPDNQENVKKYGDRVKWFVPDSPEATMRRLIAQGDVNVERPEESLLLLKPLNRVAHGGGVKMMYGDAGYKMFRAWLEDYVKSIKGKYRYEGELPSPDKQALISMNSILAVNNGPSDWGGKLLRTDVYAWDTARNAWGQKPVGTGERMADADKGQPSGTNLIMFMIVPAQEVKAEAERLRTRLTPGRYLLKYYCDTADKLSKNFTIPTDSPGFYQGEQEIKAAWGGNWGSPVKVQVVLAQHFLGTLQKNGF